MTVQAHVETRPYQSTSDSSRLLSGLRLDLMNQYIPPATPVHNRLPEPLDAEAVRRLHDEDPFFRARADRYNQLSDTIAAVEATGEAATTSRKYLEMLKRRREAILLELVELVAAKAQTQPTSIWSATVPAPRSVPSKPAPVRSWDWP